MNSKLLARRLRLILTVSSSGLFAQVPTAFFSINSATICEKEFVQITDMSANSPTAWSYSINGVAAATAQNPDLTFTLSGTYFISLEASNGSGTSAVFTETILVNSLPSLTITGNTLVCTSASETLSASGADTYSWSTGVSGPQTVINPSAGTVYTLVGTSLLTGCSDSSFVSVSTIPLPTISVSNATICTGSIYTLVPSGAATYSYSGGSNVVSPLISTNYTVSGTDASTGCSDSTIVTVFVTSAFITANSGTICAGKSFTITPAGATNYTYSGGSAVVFPTTNTTYTVTGMDTGTGCSNTVAVSVGVTPAPTITVNSASICAGKVFTIMPGGASSYTISGGSTTVAPVTNTTYVVGGTDPNTGCPGYATLSLTVSPLPVIAVNSGTLCAGDIFTLIPSGALTYTFSSDSAFVAPAITTTYSIIGTSANGCVTQAPTIATVVISGAKPNVFLNPLTPTLICLGESVDLKAFGAINYSWSTGAITSSITVSPTVTTLYTVVGTEVSTGCSATVSILENVQECSGVTEIVPGLRYALYPNPANADFFVEVSNDIEMTLVDVAGKIVFSRSLNAGKNLIELDTCPPGLYFVNLRDDNGVKTQKLIRN